LLHLSFPQRQYIEEGIAAGKSNAQIARELRVHRSTIGREIKRNADCRENYKAFEADDTAWKRQKEAMPKRHLLYGGVSFGSTLESRNFFYIYSSRSHTFRTMPFRGGGGLPWNSNYVRPRKQDRFLENSFFWIKYSGSTLYNRSSESKGNNHTTSDVDKSASSQKNNFDKKISTNRNVDKNIARIWVFDTVALCDGVVIYYFILAAMENGIINSEQFDSALQILNSTRPNHKIVQASRLDLYLSSVRLRPKVLWPGNFQNNVEGKWKRRLPFFWPRFFLMRVAF
jgi:hypothetical protein